MRVALVRANRLSVTPANMMRGWEGVCACVCVCGCGCTCV